MGIKSTINPTLSVWVITMNQSVTREVCWSYLFTFSSLYLTSHDSRISNCVVVLWTSLVSLNRAIWKARQHGVSVVCIFFKNTRWRVFSAVGYIIGCLLPQMVMRRHHIPRNQWSFLKTKVVEAAGKPYIALVAIIPFRVQISKYSCLHFSETGIWSRIWQTRYGIQRGRNRICNCIRSFGRG